MTILSHARIAVLSLLLLLHQLGGAGWRKFLWGWRRRKPVVRSVDIAPGKPADLYALDGAGPRAGLVLTHGANTTGKHDPRLVALADCLAGCGFVVLVPELAGLKSLRLVMDEADDLVAAFRWLVSLDGVDEHRAGFFGISFAAGQTVKAASDPSIRERVRFVVSFGGYYDTVNLIRYLTTGEDEYRGQRHVEPPDDYARDVFVKNVTSHVTDERDRTVLAGLVDAWVRDPEGEAAPFSPDQLTEAGRAVYELIRNRDPARVRELMEATEPAVRDYLESLSLRPVVSGVRARVLIGHGDTDPLLPFTESLRLADALPDPSRVDVAILKVVSHVDTRFPVRSVRELLTVSLPSCWRFYGLIFRILKQQMA